MSGAILWYEPMQRVLHSGIATDIDGETLELHGRFANVMLQVVGTIANVEIHFEVSIDGATWVAIGGYDLTTGTGALSAAAAEGIFAVPVPGMKFFRARRDGIGVGDVTVTAVATAAPHIQVII